MGERTSGLFKVVVRFTDPHGKPLPGTGWRVRAFDEDPLRDDELGYAALNPDGEAHLLMTVSDIKSIDSPDERSPDLYFVLERDGEEHFRSEVFRDVDFESLDPVTGNPDAITRSFGPFAVAVED